MAETIEKLTNTVKSFFTIQFLKFLIVGVSNTAVTWIIYSALAYVLGIPALIANPIGYFAGLCNSYIWNKIWVFKTKKKSLQEVVSFFLVFGVCFICQFGVHYLLSILLEPYLVHYKPDLSLFGVSVNLKVYDLVAFICGMAVYTPLNFLGNKYITFTSQKKNRQQCEENH